MGPYGLGPTQYRPWQQQQTTPSDQQQQPTNQVTIPEGMSPWLANIYKQSGLQPADRGTGFADWQYWQNEALNNAGGDTGYIAGRLSADIAGRGPDQSTGTPGQGAWQSSGQQSPWMGFGSFGQQSGFSPWSQQQPQRQQAARWTNRQYNPSQQYMQGQGRQGLGPSVSQGQPQQAGNNPSPYDSMLNKPY